ncbi:HAD family hydrolase [Dactylosporangium cerinum]|uniref:HAD family hydrolase n=1 Tax=Dactylosporangium cerinum TaxID=1434730 RepID=A0ABV9VVU1_9ACTN
MFSAVLFDYFNTCTTAVVRGDGHRQTAEVLGVDPDAWLALLDRTFDDRAKGAYGSVLTGLRALCAELGVQPTPARLRTAADLRVASLQQDAPPRPEAEPVLRLLRDRGVRTAVVSDCWFELPSVLPGTPLGRLFDVGVYSSQVGQAKPHPAMYRTACERLGVHPEACLYVGDGGGHELTGARRFGLTAVQLDAPDLGGHLTFHADLDWDGARITSLDQIPELVAGRMPLPATVGAPVLAGPMLNW